MIEPGLLRRVAALAQAYLDGLPEHHVGATLDYGAARIALDRPLGDDGIDPERVIEELCRDAAGGLVASAGPRYHGFVVGGSLPAALAADWLTSTWDQNAFSAVNSPAAAAAEAVAGAWLLELLGLPAQCSVGFVTGAQMANATALAAARHAVLRELGHDVAVDGLVGSPPIAVVLGAEAHVTVYSSLRLLGIGSSAVRVVDVDDQGRMRPDALRTVLADVAAPAIVVAQAGNVATGACDPLRAIAEAAREHGAWCHVDGAFGLWARASPEQAPLCDGAELAHSWATDGHKWLNVPYDCGYAIVSDPAAHRAAMSLTAAYLITGQGAHDPAELAPESSRRARGFATYAAIRSLGRSGVADLVARCCAQARRIADVLAAEPGIEVLNDVVLNQVLVRIGDDDELTAATIATIQADGTCWLGPTRWQGRGALRISLSSWATGDADVERSAAAIATAARVVLARA